MRVRILITILEANVFAEASAAESDAIKSYDGFMATKSKDIAALTNAIKTSLDAPGSCL